MHSPYYYARHILYAVILTVVLLYACANVKAQAAQAVYAQVCDQTTLDNFVYLTADAQAIDGVTVDELAQIDSYLRGIYNADERPHLLGFFTDDDRINQLLSFNRSWQDFSGLTVDRLRWSWSTCRRGTRADDKVSLSLLRSEVFDNETLFGLFVHEISHASGADSHIDEYRSAVYWERIGRTAYRATCDDLEFTGRPDCLTIRWILDGD